MNNWLKKFLGIFIAIFSLIGFEYKSLAAFKNSNNQDDLIAQSCPQNSLLNSPRSFAQVATQRDPLNLRSAPNGRIIGQVPKGWQVITLKTDATGKWTYITNHYGTWYGGSVGFGSAPNFRSEGWVQTSYLKSLGKFCDKPLNLNQGQINNLLSNQTILLNEEWLQLGDRIARNIS